MAKLLVVLAMFPGLVGLILIGVGLATPFWLQINGYHQGLWKFCDAGAKGTSETCNKLDEYKGFFDSMIWATRILTILACVASFISLLLLFVYLLSDNGLANLRRIIVAVALSIICALFVFIGIGVYASTRTGHLKLYDYGWSFIVTVVGGVLHLLLILGLFLEIKMVDTFGANESILNLALDIETDNNQAQ